MRITRSTLRRLIAEESARLLREAAFPEEIEAQYGRGREGEEELEEERGTRMLHVTYHGGAYEGGEGFSNVHYIVTDYDANPMGEEAEDVTAEITGGEDLDALEDAYALKDWLLSHTDVGYVVNEEMHDPETDESSTVDEYLEYLDGVIAAEEAEAGERGGEMYSAAVERGEDMGFDDEDLFEADGEDEKSPYVAAEDRLRAAVKDIRPNKATSLTNRILDALDDVLMEKAIAAVEDGSDDFPSDLSEIVLDEMGSALKDDDDLSEVRTAITSVAKTLWKGAVKNASQKLDEGDYGDKTDPYERGEGDYGKRGRYEKTGLTSSSMIWDPSGEIPLVKSKDARDINTTVNDKIADPDRTHVIRQTILGKPGFRPVAELTIDLEYDRESKRDMIGATISTDDGQTFVGLGNSAVEAIKQAEAQWREAASSGAQSSRDIMESDDDSQGEEEEDTGYFDQTDWSAAEVRAGRHAEGPYGGMDSDTPEYHARLRRSPDDLGRGRMAALAARGIRFRHGGEDVDMEPVDSDYAGDNLSEGRWAKLAGILKG